MSEGVSSTLDSVLDRTLSRTLSGRGGASITPAVLLAHWTFDEGFGTDAADSVGGYDFYLDDSTTWISGIVDGGINLDPNFAFTDPIPYASQELQLSCWVRNTDLASERNVLGSVDTDENFRIYFDADVLFVEISNTSGTFRKSLDYTAHKETRTHVSVWLNNSDEGEIKVWINGYLQTLDAELSTKTTGGIFTTNPLDLSNSLVDQFKGDLDDLYLHTGQLTESAIWTFMDRTVPAFNKDYNLKPTVDHDYTIAAWHYNTVGVLTGNSGSAFSIPSNANLHGFTDFTIQVDGLVMADYSPAADETILSRWGAGNPYLWELDSGSKLSMRITTDPSGLSGNLRASVASVPNDGLAASYRAVKSGAVLTFWRKIGDDWIKIGADVAAPNEPIAVGTGDLLVGALLLTSNNLNGSARRVRLWDDATQYNLVVDIDFSKAPVGGSSFVCETGQTVTVEGDASIANL